MNTIKVFGHKSPDTDATVSAIVYAWYLNEVQKQPAEAYVLGDLNNETKYVLDRFNFNVPRLLGQLSSDDTIIVVDTNNPDELFENINDAELVEIIDHHLLVGGISTTTPISITMRPMASTASLIYTRINPELHTISKDLAGIMLAAILSDTLEFRSPTTTEEDKIIAEELANIAGVDMHELATEMFNAKSDISHLSPEEIITMDSKIYDIHGKQMRVSVVETTNPKYTLDQKDAVKERMITHAQENNLDDVLLFVVDILNEEATFVAATNEAKSLVEKSFNVTITDDTVVLPGVVSRKKQIIPELQK